MGVEPTFCSAHATASRSVDANNYTLCGCVSRIRDFALKHPVVVLKEPVAPVGESLERPAPKWIRMKPHTSDEVCGCHRDTLGRENARLRQPHESFVLHYSVGCTGRTNELLHEPVPLVRIVEYAVRDAVGVAIRSR